jgi:hypothetical protein
MNVFELSEHALLKALTDKLLPTEESSWRFICREYSETFHTPLYVVETLDPEKVLLALHEKKLDSRNMDEDADLNVVVEAINSINDPNYDSARDKLEREWNESIALNRSTLVDKSIPKNTIDKKEKPPKTLPVSGGVNFAYLLDNQENEG